MSIKSYDAGVKEYRDMYWTPDYVPLDTDLLACFKCTGQSGVPREEVAAAVAAESSTGTWSTVWSELLTDLEYYKGRAYRIEDVPGDNESFYAFVAYPLDLFEEGSIVNVLTSLVGNVFGYTAYGYVLKRYSANFASLIGFSTPIFVTIFGWMLLGEAVSGAVALAGAVIFTGVFLFYREELKA